MDLIDPLRLRLASCRGCGRPATAIHAVAGPDALVPAHAGAGRTAQRLRHRRRLHRGRGRLGAVRADLAPVARAAAHADRRRRAPSRTTRVWWREWSSGCTYARRVDARPVQRSLITLKALTYAPDRRHRGRAHDVAARAASAACATGTTATAGCATPRSRSTRSCAAGYTDEARAWRDWLLRAVAGDPAHLQIMYGVAGERRLAEYELDWLPGLRGLGAGAHRQRRRRPVPARRLRRGARRAAPGARACGIDDGPRTRGRSSRP